MGCSTLPPREEDGGDDSDDEEEDNENDQEDWEESGRASAPLRGCNAVTRSSSSAARAASKDGKDGKESAKDKPPISNPRTLRSATADAQADDAARAAARARAEAEAAAAIRRRPKKVERPVGIALVAAVSAIKNAYREADLATTKAREAQALAERALELAEAFAAGDRIPQAHFLAKESKTWPFLPEDVMPPVESSSSSSSSSSAQATTAAKRKLGASHWAKVANAKRAPMAMPSLAPPPPSPQLACAQLLAAMPDLDTLGEAHAGSSSSTSQAKPRVATQVKQKPKPRGRPPSRLIVEPGDENSPAWKAHFESTLAAVWQDVAPSGVGEPTSISEVEDAELRRRWVSRAREVARRTFSPSKCKQEKSEPLRPAFKTLDASVERLPDATLRRQDGSHSPGPDCQRRLTLKRRPSLDPGQDLVARVEENCETGAKRRRPTEHVAGGLQDDPEAQHVFDGSQDRRAQTL